MKCCEKYEEYFSPAMADYVADTQGAIFQYAADHGWDMPDFIIKYMNSRFCNQEMDSMDSYFHYKPDTVCVSYLENEFVPKKSSGGADIPRADVCYRPARQRGSEAGPAGTNG